MPNPQGKILIIAGGIANFTNVVLIFKGVIRALKEFKNQLISHHVKIFVRRGGPNYQEGLKAMRLLGESLGVPIRIFGPDTHITEIVPLALGIETTKNRTNAGVQPDTPPARAAAYEPGDAVGTIHPDGERTQPSDLLIRFDTHAGSTTRPSHRPFDATTWSFVYGLQPSGCCHDLPFRRSPYPKVYWGTSPCLHKYRFGGAIDEAASMFSNARDTSLTPREFVDNSRKANKLSE
jgi:ATP citrate (pro-S)-lyase